jgi:hypothetical protein
MNDSGIYIGIVVVCETPQKIVTRYELKCGQCGIEKHIDNGWKYCPQCGVEMQRISIETMARVHPDDILEMEYEDVFWPLPVQNDVKFYLAPNWGNFAIDPSAPVPIDGNFIAAALRRFDKVAMYRKALDHLKQRGVRCDDPRFMIVPWEEY